MEDFVNKLVKTRSEELLIFFDSGNELSDYLIIDKYVETLGIKNEDKQEVDSKPSITLDMEENK